ncbi:MAG: glycosyltransferase [archaeon]|nr:glycosyltransferase [archaeon]MCP8314489.1 glycosyltransferase [archaeon]
MKIAFFSDTYLPNRDGVVTSILTLRKALEERGHEVFIFCSGSRQAKEKNIDDHVFYYTSIPFKPYPDYKIAFFPFLSEREVEKLGIQLVHSHGLATTGWAAVRAARSLRLPIITTFHTLIPEAIHYVAKGDRMGKFVKRIAWSYVKFYLKRSDAIIVPSNVIKDILIEHGIEKDIYLIPSSVDVKRFNPDTNGEPIRELLGIKDGHLVLYIGRLVKEKNLEVLIKAAPKVLKELPHCKFIVAGIGPAADYYKNMVLKSNLKESIIFQGYIEDGILERYYAASDVFVFPSKFETQGLTALEAMACGKPVVGADFLAIKEIVKNGYNGYLFNPDDPDDCAEKIIKTIKERSIMSKNARQTALEYSVDECIDKLLKVYKKYVNE